MVTVKQILKSKNNNVWSISPDASLYEALMLMAVKDVGALVVLEDGNLVGIFSERDYARKFMGSKRSTKETLVRELMSTPVITVRPGQSIGACMTTMNSQHVRHLPVVERDQVIGVVSIGDVVRAMINEQQQVINELSSYLTGAR
jgi:CBS domain-containing protein